MSSRVFFFELKIACLTCLIGPIVKSFRVLAVFVTKSHPILHTSLSGFNQTEMKENYLGTLISIWQWQYLLQHHIYTIVFAPWENNSNSVWYAMKLKIYLYTSKSWMEIICQSFIQKLISRIQISKPVRISLSVTVKEPGNVFLHVGNTPHGITSFPPFWLWMPLEIVCVWNRGLISQK